MKPLLPIAVLVAAGCASQKHQDVTPLPAPKPLATEYDRWPAHERRAEQWALRDFWQAEDNKREKAAMRLRMSNTKTNVFK